MTNSIPGAELVSLIDGEAVTTSLAIAEGTGNGHKALRELIEDRAAELEQFGVLRFETAKPSDQGGRPQKYALLNEPQATLLLTFMRNSEVVVRFKVGLVKAFFELRARPAIDGNSITRMELIQIAHNAETERLALEAKNAELEPKAEAYDSFVDATGKYSVGAVAKMLGSSQNKLFRDLRNAGVLIAKGAMRNTPYQQYMRHFEVKAHEYERSSGELGCSYTTYVQPAGIDFIRRKLGLPAIDPVLSLSLDGEAEA